MALEDFFTLTEMKDGLATVGRVKELMSILRKQKHCTVLSIRDEAREWSTVAGILAATENKNCLDCFIHLDGLRFLNRWLVYSLDAVGGPVEETIRLILGALQKLPLNREKYRKKLISSGIGRTIKQILALENPNVQDSARWLLEKWDFTRDEVENCQDEEEHEQYFDDELKDDTDMIEGGARSPSPVPEVSSKEGDDNRSCGTDSAENSSKHSSDNRCTSFSEAGSTKDVGAGSTKDMGVSMPTHCIQYTTPNSVDANASLGDTKTCPCQENFSTTMESSGAPAGVTGATTCNSPSLEEKNVDVQHELSQMDATCMGSKEMEVDRDTKDASQLELGQRETGSFVHDSLKEPDKESNLDLKKAESDQAEICKPQGNSDTVDCGLQNFKGSSKELKLVEKDLLGKAEDTESSFHGMKVLGTCKETKKSGSSYLRASKRLHSRHRHGSMKSTKGTNSTAEMNKFRPDVGLEYVDDALEVAVQVALEAKLEVADRERHSSSPDDNSVDETMDSSSSGSEESNQPVSRKSHTKIDQSDGGDSQEEHSSKLSENTKIDSKNPRDQEPPKTISFEESQQNTEKSKCSFDLNEDVCTEELDYLPFPVSNYQNNLSAPVAVIPTSRGTPGLPVTPLHFEGELGWRGSAATSAFRPASPRRTPDGEKTVSGPKQQANFDLNVADDENDVATDPIFEKQIPVSSGLPSGESSVEVTSAKAERLKLDLNRLGDENTFQNSSSYWKFHHSNRNGSPSPASSSNAKQSSMRDFDLNDNPSYFDSCGPNNQNRGAVDTAIQGGFKPNDPVVTIMGSKLAVERKEPVSQSQLPFLANRLGIESTMGARPAAAYPQAPTAGYGYLPPAMYGPGTFPYMVDARGATVVPPILGSSVALNGPTSRPAFLVNVSGAQSGLGAVGGSRSGLDLNTVSMSLDGGNKEIGNFSKLFMQGHNGITEEQIRAASQAAPGSSVGIKRKEPDCGRETYPIGYKQVTSWQ